MIKLENVENNVIIELKFEKCNIENSDARERWISFSGYLGTPYKKIEIDKSINAMMKLLKWKN